MGHQKGGTPTQEFGWRTEPFVGLASPGGCGGGTGVHQGTDEPSLGVPGSGSGIVGRRAVGRTVERWTTGLAGGARERSSRPLTDRIRGTCMDQWPSSSSGHSGIGEGRLAGAWPTGDPQSVRSESTGRGYGPGRHARSPHASRHGRPVPGFDSHGQAFACVRDTVRDSAGTSPRARPTACHVSCITRRGIP